MKNTFKMVSVVLVVFSLLLGLKALAASADLAPVSAGTYKSGIKIGTAITSIDKPAATNNLAVFASPAISTVPACQSVVDNKATSPVLAENVKAGNFGLNAGGGNYAFPNDLTVNGNNIHLLGLPGGDESIEFSHAGAILTQTDQGFRFTSGGPWSFDNNVGIETTNPRGKLEIVDGVLPSGAGDSAGVLTVVGVTRTFNQNAGNIVVQANDMVVQDAGGSISFGSTVNDAGAVYATFAGIKAGKENSIQGQNGGYLTFGTRANGSDLAERIRITSAGNVGIGTTNPDATLRVNGSMKANNYYSAKGNIGITKTVKLRSTYNQPCTMSFENGLLTSTTCPTQ